MALEAREGREFTRNNVGVLVCKLPRRRKASLCVRRGSKISEVAVFDSDEYAEVFEVFMAHLMGEPYEYPDDSGNDM